jgi:hypothetical protein
MSAAAIEKCTSSNHQLTRVHCALSLQGRDLHFAEQRLLELFVFHVSCLVCSHATLRLADQKVAAMDKLHFYVCQTDANMSCYLAKAVIDAERCTHDDTLRLMNSCSKGLDEFDSDNEDDEDAEESVVNDDAVEEVTSDSEESEDDAEDDDDDLPAAFTRDAIGAGRGQLRQVPPCLAHCALSIACAN